MPGVLEINAVEYYANEIEDNIEKGVVGGLIAEPVNPNPQSVEETIVGETFIKPKKTYEFTYNGNLVGEWSVSKGAPVKLEKDGKTVRVKWLDTYTGQFDLCYADVFKKTIVVESLF